MDIASLVQLFNTPVVGIFGPDFTQGHQILPIDAKRILKAVVIPILEDGHVETDMGGSKAAIAFDMIIESVEVTDVIHSVLPPFALTESPIPIDIGMEVGTLALDG